jgi:uncharacterized membrane protein YdjX (TVP38/TMEM64 family)
MTKEKATKIVAILKLVLLVGIILGLSISIYLFSPEFLRYFQDLDELKMLLANYKAASILIYLLLQIIQVVISVIPGQILQFAAGYIYGFVLGTVLSLVGVALGTIITFYLAKVLGKDAMHVLFGEERISKFVQILNSKKAYIFLFIFFVIPGLPKDLLTYAAGISEIRLKPFLILSLVGRAPALMVTIAMSRMLYNGSYIELVLLIIISVILFGIGIIKKDVLIAFGNAMYDKWSK